MKTRSFLTLALMLASAPLGLSNPFFSGDWVYTLNDSSEATITGYLGPGGEVEIPSSIDGYAVKVVGDGSNAVVNYDTPITSLVIPNTVTRLNYYAFGSNQTLTTVTIPSSVSIISSAAFVDCIALTNLTIVPGMNLSWIGDTAFAGCPITGPVTVPLFATVWPDAFPSGVVVRRDLGTLASALQSRPSRQTISLKVASKTKVGSSIPVRAIATSKLPVAVTSSDPDILRIVGSNALALTKGSVTLTATQEGNANFLPATPVTKSVTVE